MSPRKPAFRHRPARHRRDKPAAAGGPALERIFGKHSVRAVFLTRPQEIRRLVIAGDESYHQDFIAMAAKTGLAAEFMAWPEFLRLGGFTDDDKHQGIFILAEPRTIYGEKDLNILAGARTVVALDQVTNPQNFATILRGAAFFGVDAVIVLRDRSVDVSPEAVRYAVGGAEFVKIFRVTNLSHALKTLKALDFWVYGLDERGERTLAETEFPDHTVLVIGAEGEGLRAKTKDYCDWLVNIPGGREGVESLNAAVAATLGMAELFRKPK